MQKNKAPSFPIPTEAEEQIALFEWARLQTGRFPELALLYHVPNGGSRNKIEAARLRAQGVKSGVPDLCLPVARGASHGLYIELKRQRGGRISEEQVRWINGLLKQGYAAAICKGWQEAAKRDYRLSTAENGGLKMAKKKAGISEEVREAINEAARAGAYEAYKNTAGAYVNYFKAMETLLYNYKKLAALVADEEGYCEVEYHAGRKTFAAGSKSTGYYEQKTEADIIAEMQEEKRRQYRETKYGFERLERAINLYRDRKEFTVVRMYYFGEDYEGKPRENGKPYTWEELAFELEEAGVLKGVKTACRWRNKIVNDMAVCVFGIAAAVSAATYRRRAGE